MNAIYTLPKAILTFALLLISTMSLAYTHPAELRIDNNSQRLLAVKVMAATGQKHTTMTIGSNSSKTINIQQTGNYYLKTKATYQDRKPVYKKGNPFRVYVGSDGYSILTITFSIQESTLPDPMSGEQISKAEFERDSD